MPPEVAICIVTHNSERHIGPALAAVATQEGPLAVHVWDNASRDGTVDVVRVVPGVVLHRSDVNLGFCAANNRLIESTDEPFMLFLNPDTVLRPGCVAKLQQVLAAAPPDVAAVGPKLVKPGGATIDSAGIVLVRHKLSPHDRGDGEPDRGQFDIPGPYFGPSFACALWRREAIEALRLGGEFLDERFFAYFEDVDIAWRARRLGWRFLYEPAAVCEHERGRPDRHGVALAARAFVNRYLLWLANEDGDNGWSYLAWAIPREAARLVWKSFDIKGFFVVWRMLYQDWRGALRKRRLLAEKAGVRA